MPNYLSNLPKYPEQSGTEAQVSYSALDNLLMFAKLAEFALLIFGLGQFIASPSSWGSLLPWSASKGKESKRPETSPV
jgi:hypothetical protein